MKHPVYVQFPSYFLYVVSAVLIQTLTSWMMNQVEYKLKLCIVSALTAYVYVAVEREFTDFKRIEFARFEMGSKIESSRTKENKRGRGMAQRVPRCTASPSSKISPKCKEQVSANRALISWTMTQQFYK